MTACRLLDPEETLRRLETRLGPLHAKIRLGMEREHEAQAFGQGLSFLHLENMSVMQAIIELTLRVTGTYWLGLANAGKVQVRHNAGVPTATADPVSKLSRAYANRCVGTYMRCSAITIRLPWFPTWKRSAFGFFSTNASS